MIDQLCRWLQYTSNCNFPLWKLKELRVKVVSILGEGGEEALSSFGEMRGASHFSASMPATSCSLMRHDQLTSLPIGYTRKEQFYILSHLASQVNWPPALRENYCACSWSISSINDKKMISCVGVYWICHFNSWISHPGLCPFASKRNLITRYPVIFNFRENPFHI